ncbi:MAG: DUF2953 domain-containing protein [Oscillospiraceae bacterium]|nr:DUF2953 domain-containing protein [Oscillospiraceae bacterium]
MGWYIALGIIILLAILPLGVSVKYDEDGALVKVIAGLIRITLFPRPKKQKKDKKKTDTPEVPKPKKEKAQKEKAPVKQKGKDPVPVKEQPKKKKGGSITDFLPLVKVALNFLSDFRRKLRVNVLELKLIMAGNDPCDLAVNYGRAWAAVGNLLLRLERVFVIKKRDIQVECDFTESETKVIARLDLTITLGRLLAAVFVFAFHALVEFLKILNKRKGGAVNEPKSS